MSTSSDIVALFLHLVRFDGTSLDERIIADAVSSLLRPENIHVFEDGSASLLSGNAGNLFCFPPDYRKDAPAIMLTAHLDTVKSTAAVQPVVESTLIRSDGSTILGADDRAGCAVLVRLLLDAARKTIPYRNFFVLFTVGEETGLFGAGTASLSNYNTTGAYVFDCSKRPGTYIRESVGLSTFKAEFIGKSAHSGVAPEEGVSAIQLASAAIARLELGRIDAETTANIGTISGGEALNAIPEKVTIEGEVRAFSPDRITHRLGVIEHTLRDSVGARGKVNFHVNSEFLPYVHAEDAPLIVHLERAIQAAGLRSHPIRYTGGSDANKYNAKGTPAVNLGIGAQKPHSHEEFILIEDLVSSYNLAVELVRP
jgi:tripeptide aminopeptidase